MGRSGKVYGGTSGGGRSNDGKSGGGRSGSIRPIWRWSSRGSQT